MGCQTRPKKVEESQSKNVRFFEKRRRKRFDWVWKVVIIGRAASDSFEFLVRDTRYEICALGELLVLEK